MTKPKVSIIIPIYKVEHYIEKCVRTLFGQTLDSLEYIFVDDCSPDNSVSIIERVLCDFPERKKLVKIIRHKNNQGIGQSRQDGVDASTGEYIIHCDSDDWVEQNMYELLYYKAKETDADMVICDYSYVDKDILTYCVQCPQELNSISLLEGISGRKHLSIHGGTWNKLIKAELYKSVKFSSDINYCEDVYFWFQILKKELKISYVKKALYYYAYNTSSITQTYSDNAQTKDINLINKVILLISNAEDERYKLCCYSFIVSVIYFRFFRMGNLKNDKFKECFRTYLKYVHLNKNISKIFKILLIISMCGYYEQVTNIRDFFRKIRRRNLN